MSEMWPGGWRNLWWFLLALFILFWGASGCRSASDVKVVGGGIAARQDAIVSVVGGSSAESWAKGFVREQADLTKREAAGLERGLADSASDASRWRQRYESLRDDWWTRYGGQTVKRWLLWITVGWFVVGLLAVLSGLNPLGMGARVGREIVRLVPFMNPFSWIRDWLVRRTR